jgi:hypothetical protein
MLDSGPDNDVEDTPSDANLIASAKADGGFLGDFTAGVVNSNMRIPLNRHPGGKANAGIVNVLYGDLHAGATRPTHFTVKNGKTVPDEFSPKVRISPYRPYEFPKTP